jgi:hypothetical protein
MTRLIHFGKVFVVVWLIFSAIYVLVVLKYGFGVGLQGHPPIWLVRLVFYLWPAVPAVLIAATWELLRITMAWRNRSVH